MLPSRPLHLWMVYAAERAAAFLKGRRFLIRDRDTKFCCRFKIVTEVAGIQLVRASLGNPAHLVFWVEVDYESHSALTPSLPP